MDSLEQVLQDIREWCDKNGHENAKEVRINRSCGVRVYDNDIGIVLTDFILIKKLITVCDDDLAKCRYDLPKIKPQHESAVKDIGINSLGDIYIQCKDSETNQRILRQLEAQYKIIDIIQKTQAEIDPDWVADWGDHNQEKWQLNLYFGRLDFCLSCIRSTLPAGMYSSLKVMKHIVTYKLITSELFKQWQTGE